MIKLLSKSLSLARGYELLCSSGITLPGLALASMSNQIMQPASRSFWQKILAAQTRTRRAQHQVLLQLSCAMRPPALLVPCPASLLDLQASRLRASGDTTQHT